MEAMANPKPEAKTRGVRSTLTELVPTDEQEDSENWKKSPVAGVDPWPFNGLEYVQLAVNMGYFMVGNFSSGFNASSNRCFQK